MIVSANLIKQVCVRTKNEVGALADVAKIVADRGLNLEAIAGYHKEGTNTAEIMLVADVERRAAEALTEGGYDDVSEHECILVELENKPGALKILAGKLAEADINITCTYGTICGGPCPAKIVLVTDNLQETLIVLKR